MKLLQLKSRKNFVQIQSNLLKNIGNAASQGFQIALVTFFFRTCSILHQTNNLLH